jgi:hypothetical protein
MENVKTNNKTELTFMEFCEKKKTDYSEFFDLVMSSQYKTWRVDYHDNKDGYFPSLFKKNNRGRYTKNIEQKHLVYSVYLYCKDMGLYLEGYGNKVSTTGDCIGWGSKYTGHFPERIYPTFSLMVLGKYGNRLSNNSFYENKHYKKYIDDNDGKCPLPLPNLEGN